MMIEKNKIENYFYISIFLVPALLLTTPNYSVIVIVSLFLASTGYLIKNKQSLNLNRIDVFFVIASSSYLFGFIPITIIDGSTLRYFDAPLRFLIGIPIYLLARQLLVNKTLNFDLSRQSLEYGVILGSIGAFSLALYQVIFEGRARVDGFLFSINFAYLACSLAFLCLVLFKSSKHKIFNLIGFTSAVIATVLTGTRGAIFAIPMMLSVTLFFLYRDKLSIVKVLLFILSLSTVAVSFYQFNTNVKKRIDLTTTEIQKISQGDVGKAKSSGGRLQLWAGAIEAFKRSPFVGETHHNREIINQKIYDNSKYKNKVVLVPRGHAHSQYFEILASAGLIGVIALFLYLIMPLIYYLYLFLKNERNTFALCGFIFTTGISIFAVTEVLLQANLISAYYAFMQATLLALAISYHHLPTSNPKM